MASGSSSVPPSETDTDMAITAAPTASTSSVCDPGAHAPVESNKPQAHAGDGAGGALSAAAAAAAATAATTAGVAAGTDGPGCRVDTPGSSANDDDGEVFHSALQLACADDLEGVGGCAGMVHQDTFYGDMRVRQP